MVTGPSDRFSEAYVVAAPPRRFTEPGIEYPGLPGLPIFDGNPEIFELDPDALGLMNQDFNAGSTFQASGIMSYAFGSFTLWPTSLNVANTTLPIGVRSRNDGEVTLGTLDAFRLFDDIDDPSSLDALGNQRNDITLTSMQYGIRIDKMANYIVNVLDAPDILALQEVEKIEVLQDLATAINALNNETNYSVYLEEGNDLGTIDIGFLVLDESIQVNQITQIGKSETFINPDNNMPALVHERPPLLLEGVFKGKGIPFAVLGVHIRSRSQVSSSGFARAKRLEQSQAVASIVQDYQTNKHPYAYLAVLGNFNATQFTDGYVDVVGQITGDMNPSDNLLSAPSLTDPGLYNEVLQLPSSERYSINFEGNAEVVDQILTTSRMHDIVSGVEYGRGNSDAPWNLLYDENNPISLRSSDHDGMVVFLNLNIAVIPTLSQWGLIILSILILIFGMLNLKGYIWKMPNGIRN